MPVWRLALLGLLVPAMAGCLAAPQSVEPAGVSIVPDFYDVAWDAAGNYSRVLVRGTLDALPVERLDVASFDCTPIAAALWRPRVSEGTRVPVILTISPYFEDRLAEEDPWTKEFFLDNFVRHGYAYAHVAVRGTSDSGGCMETMGLSEQRDFDEVVTYFGSRPWSNGNVAIIGKSYVGTTPWAAAAFGNPYLKAIVPISGLTSWADLGYRNGTSESRAPVHAELYWQWFGLGLINIDNPGYRLARAAEQACPAVAEGQAMSLWSWFTGEHEGPGPLADYWTVRDFRERVRANYQGAIYLVHGLQDWNVEASMAFPFVTELQREGRDVEMLLGQWHHDHPDGPRDGPLRWDWAEQLLRWFDRHLKGLAVDTGPLVDVQDSGGLWRVEDTWPPADATMTTFHLGRSEPLYAGTLSPEPTAAGEAAAANPAGAVDVRRCLGRAVAIESDFVIDGTGWNFATAPLEHELRFAGLVQAHLTVVPSSPWGGVLYAELWDIPREGFSARELAHGTMDLRFHSGGNEAQTIVPGRPVLAEMELFPADVVIPAGHHLALAVFPDAPAKACAEFPGPIDLGGNTLPSLTPTPMVLQWGDAKSVLRLPVIERDVGDGRYPGQPVP